MGQGRKKGSGSSKHKGNNNNNNNNNNNASHNAHDGTSWLDFEHAYAWMGGFMTTTANSTLGGTAASTTTTIGLVNGEQRFSWKEMAIACAYIFLCFSTSISVGITAGIAISIQYFDPTPLSLDDESSYHLNRQRITIGDPRILRARQTGQRSGSSASPTGSTSGGGNRGGGGFSSIRWVGFTWGGSSRQAAAREPVLPLVDESDPLWDDDEEGDGPRRKSGSGARHRRMDPPHLTFEQYSKVEWVLCSDGQSYGIDSLASFQLALHEANAYSADRYMRWNKFFSTEGGIGRYANNKLHFYEEEIIIPLCPGTVLTAREGPLAFVNAENTVVECEDSNCILQVQSGSHLSFGTHAKNVLLRGLIFQGATHTSLLFHHDGAEVAVEDCLFWDNTGPTKSVGTVADVNSTSYITFYQCYMKNGPHERPLTSLSIRSKDVEL